MGATDIYHYTLEEQTKIYGNCTDDEFRAGENLFRAYKTFFNQFQAPHYGGWNDQSLGAKLTFIKTAKAIKHGI